MDKKILSLATKFIEIPSTGEKAENLAEILNLAKSELTNYEHTSFKSNGISSLLFRNRTENTLSFKIILNAHLDVVAGKIDQFKAVQKDGRLFGRGAYDMKAAAAVMILLFNEIGNQVDYPLGLQITTDEEIGGENGTGYQLKKGIEADFAITGEGTNFSIIHESKIRMLIKLTARGKTSHGAYPWLGENAIHKMQTVIHRLHLAYPIPTSEWHGTTLNVTSISTENIANNKTPDHCEALLDARVAPDERETIINSIKNIVTDDINLQIVINGDTHQSDPNSSNIKRLQSISNNILKRETLLKRAHGTSDARYFTRGGNEGIEFGPVGGGPHSEDEWVDIQSLTQYYLILKKFLLA